MFILIKKIGWRQYDFKKSTNYNHFDIHKYDSYIFI